MSKTKYVLISFAIIILLLTVFVGTTSAKIVYVDNNGGADFTEIQDAVAAADDGDAIIVRDGTYIENVNVNKPLTIRSENGSSNCVVQAVNSDDHVFNITSDYVNIRGFTVTGAITWPKAGIYLWDAYHCDISNNNLSNNYYGILLSWRAYEIHITNNIVNSNKGYGICLSWGSNLITNNIVNSNKGGIYLESGSNNNTITNNIANANKGHGIHLFHSSNNTITNNTVNRNHAFFGISLDFSSNNNLITNNIASNNWYGGIHLRKSSNNIMRSNNVSSNDRGIFLDLSSNNTATKNNVLNNDCGIWLGSSNNNLIFLNSFMNNKQNVDPLGSTNIWNSTEKITYTYKGSTCTNYLGNYWDDYTGADTNNDGIGDTSYVIDEDNDNYPLMLPFENYITSTPGLTPIVTPTPTSPQPETLIGDSDWSMFRHDLLHTGATNEAIPDKLKLIWSYHTGSSGGGETPVISDGKVFGGSCRGVYCLDADTGDLIWDFVTEDVDSSPAVYEGKVFVGSEGNKTFCLNADTGKLIWSFETEGSVYSSPAISDGNAFVISCFKLYCLNANTGELIWSYKMSGGKSSPAVYEGKVFAGSNDKNIYCLNADTGELIWKYKTGGFVVSSPAIYEGKVFVGSNDKKVYCLNADTGELIWCYRTQGIIHSSPAVSDDKVFVGSWDGRLYCLGADTGVLIGYYETEDLLVDSSPVISDGKLFVGSNKNIYCLNADTGELIWNYTTGSSSYPVVSANRIFVMSDKLYCFGGKEHPTPRLPTGDDKSIPGFVAIFAIAGLLAVAYLLRKRK